MHFSAAIHDFRMENDDYRRRIFDYTMLTKDSCRWSNGQHPASGLFFVLPKRTSNQGASILDDGTRTKNKSTQSCGWVDLLTGRVLNYPGNR